MKLDLFNINDFIEANHCPEVTNPIFFNYDTTPTTDGLFSYELFGYTDEERKNTFGYIDLKGHYIHPIIWLMINKRMGSLGDLVNGRAYAVIADRKIKIVNEDFPGAESGIDFLYDNYEYINWIDTLEESEIDSIDKKTRLKFLKSLGKDEFFVDKWLVLPPFYRAENSANKSMGDVVNKLYKELISKVRGMNLGFSFDIFGEETKIRIQNILKDIYLSTTAPVSGKNLIIESGKSEGELKGSNKSSMMRKHLLGKNVDWSASAVITSPPNSSANSLKDKPVPYGYSAFPMATLLALFQPFYLVYAQDFLENELSAFANDFAAEISQINISQFNSAEIEKLIKKFIKSPATRNDPIKFSFKNKEGKTITYGIPLYEYKSEADAKNRKYSIKRPLTITDLFYLVSKATLEDKHVYVTRFPITNFQNIFPSKVKLLTTSKTRHIWVGIHNGESDPQEFTDYPTIKYDSSISNIDSEFADVMLCGNVYLDALGGDYDGDMLYMRAVFTKEANDEAEKLIWAKTNVLNAQGQLSRGLSKIGKECVLGLYELTKEVK